MRLQFAEAREFLRIASEALGRYKLRTSLSVLGVVLGVAAVIAMMSVSEGAAREALAQVESLGLDNVVARRSGSPALGGSSGRGLTVADASRAGTLIPQVVSASPLLSQFTTVSRGGRSAVVPVLGVRPDFRSILRLALDRGRFLSFTDERASARVCVLGSLTARQLFGYLDPIGERVRISTDYYQVIGVLGAQGSDTGTGNTLAWHDVNRAAFVPFPALSGRTLELAPTQPADEIWLHVASGEQVASLGAIFERLLARTHRADEFTIVVPRELLAQRYRVQRTFSVVVGSVAALALIVGGIGIMNSMLTSVVERTREIGVRRTVGATRRDVLAQFLVEALLMTVGGGAIGIVAGTGVAWAISAFAGWSTYVSAQAIVLGFFVSVCVGVTFGLYPATKAAALQPVDAMRYE